VEFEGKISSVFIHTKSLSWESKGDIEGKIEKVSSNAKEIVSDADIILICSPAHTKNGLKN